MGAAILVVGRTGMGTSADEKGQFSLTVPAGSVVAVSFVGYSERDHSLIEKFQGFNAEVGLTFWRKSLAAYLGTNNERKLNEVEDKARILGYTRMIRRSIRRKGLETEAGRAEIQLWKDELLGLLEKTDTLLYSDGELELEAADGNLAEVQAFVDERLEAAGCPPKA